MTAPPRNVYVDSLESLPANLRAAVERRRDVLGPGYKLFYDRPIEFVRGEGVYLFDAHGDRYLDAYNNVPSVGHAHPYVAERVSRQLRLVNTHTRYLSSPLVDYAERLLAKHTGALKRVMITCTGSEAVDLALRIARSATGERGVVVTANAYHGVTESAAAISPSLGLPLDSTVCPVPAPAHGDGKALARAVAEAIDRLNQRGVGFAAFVSDTLFASDGLFPAPEGVLAPAVAETRRRGGIFVADEVQAGFARVGASFWGYRRHGIEPDLVVMGKPMANGLPVAGVAGRAELIDAFGEQSRYFNTFGGSTALIAAADAVLDVLEQEELAANADSVGSYLRDRLLELAAHDWRLGEIRQAGLYLGVDVIGDQGADPHTARLLVNGLRDRSVLIGATGPTAATLKIRPPLPFSRANADELVAKLEAALQAT